LKSWRKAPAERTAATEASLKVPESGLLAYDFGPLLARPLDILAQSLDGITADQGKKQDNQTNQQDRSAPHSTNSFLSRQNSAKHGTQKTFSKPVVLFGIIRPASERTSDHTPIIAEFDWC